MHRFNLVYIVSKAISINPFTKSWKLGLTTLIWNKIYNSFAQCCLALKLISQINPSKFLCSLQMNNKRIKFIDQVEKDCIKSRSSKIN